MLIRLLILITPFLLQTGSALADDLCHLKPVERAQRFVNPDLRIAFHNSGGLKGGGVCWWHSRLQRSVIYLAEFAPYLPKPTSSQALTIVKDLIDFKKVVTIPGYSSFYAFSRDHQAMIQNRLEAWQRYDGFVNQAWVLGISGKTTDTAQNLSGHMDQIFQRYKKHGPGLWLLIQLPGIPSHAHILVGMDAINNGYQMHVIDSNSPAGMVTVTYHRGDTHLSQGNEPYIPYIAYNNDLKKISDALRAHCKKR